MKKQNKQLQLYKESFKARKNDETYPAKQPSLEKSAVFYL